MAVKVLDISQECILKHCGVKKEISNQGYKSQIDNHSNVERAYQRGLAMVGGISRRVAASMRGSLLEETIKTSVR